MANEVTSTSLSVLTTVQRKKSYKAKQKKSLKKKKIMAKLTIKQKYNSLKRQTENAGMKVYEKKGRLIVARKKK